MMQTKTNLKKSLALIEHPGHKFNMKVEHLLLFMLLTNQYVLVFFFFIVAIIMTVGYNNNYI